MHIELLSISKSAKLHSEKETAETLCNALKHAVEFQNCTFTIRVEKRPPEEATGVERIKHDIIIDGDCPESVIDSLTKCAAYTHFTVDGVMHHTTFYHQFLNLINNL